MTNTPFRDAIAAELAILDDDVDRAAEIARPYGFNDEQRAFVIAALMLPKVGDRDVDELREALEKLARGGAGTGGAEG